MLLMPVMIPFTTLMVPHVQLLPLLVMLPMNCVEPVYP